METGKFVPEIAVISKGIVHTKAGIIISQEL